MSGHPLLRASYYPVQIPVLFVLAGVACAPASSVESTSSDLVSESERALPPGAGPGLTLSIHTTLGIPEAASVGDPQHYLLVKPQYVTSFDSQRKNPRWTSWDLTTAWIGSSGRSPAFKTDTMLPSTIPQPVNSDYTNSGFERGHLCPSGDRTDSASDNQATFVFTNVVPQTAQSNTGTWESLETEERTLAKAGNTVFIIAGSLYTDNHTIGTGVAVPSSMYKIVVVMSGANPSPTDVTTSTRVIAVEIPNTTTVSGDYTHYRTSFGALEQKSGFRFLSDVPAAVHDALASHVDGE